MKAHLAWTGMRVPTQKDKAVSQIKALEKIPSLPSYVYAH